MKVTESNPELLIFIEGLERKYCMTEILCYQCKLFTSKHCPADN